MHRVQKIGEVIPDVKSLDNASPGVEERSGLGRSIVEWGGGICMGGILCVAYAKMLEACLHLYYAHFNEWIDSLLLDEGINGFYMGMMSHFSPECLKTKNQSFLPPRCSTHHVCYSSDNTQGKNRCGMRLIFEVLDSVYDSFTWSRTAFAFHKWL